MSRGGANGAASEALNRFTAYFALGPSDRDPGLVDRFAMLSSCHAQLVRRLQQLPEPNHLITTQHLRHSAAPAGTAVPSLDWETYRDELYPLRRWQMASVWSACQGSLCRIRPDTFEFVLKPEDLNRMSQLVSQDTSASSAILTLFASVPATSEEPLPAPNWILMYCTELTSRGLITLPTTHDVFSDLARAFRRACGGIAYADQEEMGDNMGRRNDRLVRRVKIIGALLIAVLCGLDAKDFAEHAQNLMGSIANYIKDLCEGDPRCVEVPLPSSSGLDSNPPTRFQIRMTINHEVTFRFIERAFTCDRPQAFASGLREASESLVEKLKPLEDEVLEWAEKARAAYNESRLSHAQGNSTSTAALGEEGAKVTVAQNVIVSVGAPSDTRLYDEDNTNPINHPPLAKVSWHEDARSSKDPKSNTGAEGLTEEMPAAGEDGLNRIDGEKATDRKGRDGGDEREKGE